MTGVLPRLHGTVLSVYAIVVYWHKMCGVFVNELSTFVR